MIADRSSARISTSFPPSNPRFERTGAQMGRRDQGAVGGRRPLNRRPLDVHMITDESSIRGWPDLSALVTQQFKKGWIYRGVRKSSYPLRPGIGREGARRDVSGLDLPYDVGEEQRQLRQFTREARAEFEYEPKTPLEWMILGQHHRLPTRLMDWSESLLGAAFFAVEDPRFEAAIYGVEAPTELEDLAIDPFASEIGEIPRLIRPPISVRVSLHKKECSRCTQSQTETGTRTGYTAGRSRRMRRLRSREFWISAACTLLPFFRIVQTVTPNTSPGFTSAVG
jgi:FRG domain